MSRNLRCISFRLHGVILQKTVLFILVDNSVKTSNLEMFWQIYMSINFVFRSNAEFCRRGFTETRFFFKTYRTNVVSNSLLLLFYTVAFISPLHTSGIFFLTRLRLFILFRIKHFFSNSE